MIKLADRWRTGETLLGGWAAMPGAFSAEVLASVGFDWVCVDAQHGMATADGMLAVLHGLRAAGCPALVRVPWNEPAGIMHALDAGAEGVIVPMVDSPTEAAAAAAACRYAPAGVRSFGPTRAALMDPGLLDVTRANVQTFCAVMIETPGAAAELDAIAAVPGVNALFVGPADLSLSITGDPTQLDDRRVQTVLAAVARTCAEHGLVAGMFCATNDVAITWGRAGYRMLAIQSDVRFLRAAAVAALTDVQSQLGIALDPGLAHATASRYR